MKAARMLAVTILLLAGILCFIRYIKVADENPGWLFLACAVVFWLVGILLLLHIKYAPLTGLICTSSVFLLGMFLIMPASNDLFLGLIYFLGVIGAILCFFLLLGKKKSI